LNTAVSLSGVSTLSRLAKVARPRGWCFFRISSNVYFTSAEVKGVPSCHFTPSRSLKVTLRPSSDTVQDVARAGIGSSLRS
jgi:hypothetical protein